MKPAAALAIVLLAIAAFAFSLHMRRTSPQSRESLIAERETAMLTRAVQAGKVDTVVLGDSITEMNDLGDLCGVTFNAGVGGAAIEDLRRFAPPVLRSARPTRLVLAIGTNDVLLGGAYVARFRRDYAALLDSLPVRPFALVGVDGGDNGFIASEARRIGAAYLPPVARSMTLDGVHPNEAGLRLWRTRVGAACPTGGEPRRGR